MILILVLICLLFFPSDTVTGDTAESSSAAEAGGDGAVRCGPEGVSCPMAKAEAGGKLLASSIWAFPWTWKPLHRSLPISFRIFGL